MYIYMYIYMYDVAHNVVHVVPPCHLCRNIKCAPLAASGGKCASLLAPRKAARNV